MGVYCIESVDHFGENWHLNNNETCRHEHWYISLLIKISSNSTKQGFIIFSIQVLYIFSQTYP